LPKVEFALEESAASKPPVKTSLADALFSEHPNLLDILLNYLVALLVLQDGLELVSEENTLTSRAVTWLNNPDVV
jgi:hypothetical protein